MTSADAGLGRGSVTDAKQVEERFQTLAAEAARFSTDVAGFVVPGGTDRFRIAAQNLVIAQTVFAKWCIEIFVILHNMAPIGFEEVRQKIGGISPRVLSRRLRMMEDEGLVQRTVVNSRPPGVRYSLTEAGGIVARIGTPVFLFLSFRKRSSQNTSDLNRRE
jgi:hypothetical protein